MAMTKDDVIAAVEEKNVKFIHQSSVKTLVDPLGIVMK